LSFVPRPYQKQARQDLGMFRRSPFKPASKQELLERLRAVLNSAREKFWQGIEEKQRISTNI